MIKIGIPKSCLCNNCFCAVILLTLIYCTLISIACAVTDGTVEGVNFAESDRPRRQDWPGDLVENGMFYFATADLVRERRLQGGRCVLITAGLPIKTKMSFFKLC